MPTPSDDTAPSPEAAAKPGLAPSRRRLPCNWLIVLVLVAAGLLSFLSGIVATPGSMPDEDEHYAYIKYLADHYGQFPVDFGSMFLYDRTRPNTATHPPLYYYILATAYRVLEPNRHFTAIGREKDEFISGISRGSVVPILRVVSWGLLAVGFLGVYRLTRYFIRIGLLRPWAAVAAVTLMSFIPAYTYIGGGLNNDIAVLALWPFVTRYATKYYLTGRANSFWKAVFVLSAGILSKGTFWFFVLAFAVLVAARLLEDVYRAMTGGRRSVTPASRRGTRQLAATCVWALLAIGMTAAAGTHVVTNLTRYGALQPDARNIHKGPDGKFLLPPLPEPGQYPHQSFSAVDKKISQRLLETTVGFLGHTERDFRSHIAGFVVHFRVAIILILLSSCDFFVKTPPSRRLKLLLFTYLVTVAGYYILYVDRQYRGWPTAGILTAQGRYFIGYLHLLILALFILVGTQLSKGPVLLRGARVVLAGGGLAVLFLLLCDPMFYLRNTMESYQKAQVERIVRAELQSQHFEELPIELSSPAEPPVANGRRGLLGRNSMIGGEIAVPAEACGDFELAIWARGDQALGRKAQLGIGLGDAALVPDRLKPPSEPVRQIVEADAEIEVYRVRVPIAELHGPRQLVFIRLLNQPAFESRIMREIWPSVRHVGVYGVYYRFTDGWYGEIARRAADLTWKPLNDVTLSRTPEGLHLEPTGDDAQIETEMPPLTGPGATVLLLHLTSPAATSVQWFPDSGAGYRGEESATHAVPAGSDDVAIRLPARVKTLRFDTEGSLTIRSAEFVTYGWTPLR